MHASVLAAYLPITPINKNMILYVGSRVNVPNNFVVFSGQYGPPGNTAKLNLTKMKIHKNENMFEELWKP
jgi:hypothetical protein